MPAGFPLLDDVGSNNMSPRLTMDDAPNCSEVHPEPRTHLGERSASVVEMPDRLDISFCEPCCAAPFSTCETVRVVARPAFLARRTSTTASALRDHVGRVVSLRPEEEMIRTAARRIVATMEDAKPSRDGAAEECPRETMSWDAMPGDTKLPIPELGLSRIPSPASGSGFDLRHEPCEELRVGTGECGKLYGSHVSPPSKDPVVRLVVDVSRVSTGRFYCSPEFY